MRAIFISYRREDSEGQAGRLFDDLVAQFGQDSVFMDVAGIEPGRDFRRAIDEQVATCGVLLAMMGKDWVDAQDESGRRRLDDPMDFVRLETASALKRDIPVIPVLVRGASMPRAEELPSDLAELAYRNAVELSHARWDSDVQVLVNALRPHVKLTHDDVRSARSAPTAGTAGFSSAPIVADDVPPVTVRRTKKTRFVIAAISAISLALIVFAALAYVGYKEESREAEAAKNSGAQAQSLESPQPSPTNPVGISGGGSPPVTEKPAEATTAQQAAESSPSEGGIPATYTLVGTWEDDEGKVFATVAESGESGVFEMEQIKPAKEHDTLWNAKLKGRDVEIDVFAMPSGSHQVHMELRLSLDGNRMAGLLHPGGASPEFPPSPVRFRRIK